MQEKKNNGDMAVTEEGTGVGRWCHSSTVNLHFAVTHFMRNGVESILLFIFFFKEKLHKVSVSPLSLMVRLGAFSLHRFGYL